MDEDFQKRRERLRLPVGDAAKRKLFAWLPFRSRVNPPDVADVPSTTSPVEVLETGVPLFFDDLPPIPSVVLRSPVVSVSCPADSFTTPVVAEEGVLRGEYNFSTLLLNRDEYLGVLGATPEDLDLFSRGILTPSEVSTRFGLPLHKATVAVNNVQVQLTELEGEVEAELLAGLSCWYRSDEITITCSGGRVGSPLTLPAGTRLSPVSKEDANNLAIEEGERRILCVFTHPEISVPCYEVADPYWSQVISVLGGGTIPAGVITANTQEELQTRIAARVDRLRSTCRYSATILDVLTTVSNFCIQESHDEVLEYTQYDVQTGCKVATLPSRLSYKRYTPIKDKRERVSRSRRTETFTSEAELLAVLNQEVGGSIAEVEGSWVYLREETISDDSQLTCFQCNLPAVAYCEESYSIACSPVPVAVVDACEFSHPVAEFDSDVQDNLNLLAATEVGGRLSCLYGNDPVENTDCVAGQFLVQAGFVPGCEICGPSLGAVNAAAEATAQARTLCSSDPGAGGGGGGVGNNECVPFLVLPVDENTVQVCPGRVKSESLCDYYAMYSYIIPNPIPDDSETDFDESEPPLLVHTNTFKNNPACFFGPYDVTVPGQIFSGTAGSVLYLHLRYKTQNQTLPDCEKLLINSITIIDGPEIMESTGPNELLAPMEGPDRGICTRTIHVPLAKIVFGPTGPIVTQYLSDTFVTNYYRLSIYPRGECVAESPIVPCTRFCTGSFETAEEIIVSSVENTLPWIFPRPRTDLPPLF